MTIRIIDRGRKEQILEGRLDFIRALVESEMHESQAPAHHDEILRITELKQKFEDVRSRLTVGNLANRMAQDVDEAIREKKSGAFKVQTSLEIKKLLDLI